MNGLILHSGANKASIEQVANVPTPDATETWQPVPHKRLIDTVYRAVEATGFRITQAAYGLWNDGARLFGVLTLQNGHNAEDYALALGIRNSHDKRFPVGLCVGSSVFVCDNLAFSSEITVLRKHTNRVLLDLDRLVATAAGRIGEHRVLQDRRITAYKGYELDNSSVHDILIRSVDAKVIPNADVPKVLSEWRAEGARHEEFAPRTGWSLFNAYTEVLKESNALDLPQRTQRLHGLLDLASGALIQQPQEN